MNYTIKDILNICKGCLINGKDDVICDNFTNDTRTLAKGDVYIAIKGEVYDGASFYLEAIKKGAKAIIVNESAKIDIKKCEEVSIITVKDTIVALQTLAEDKRKKYKIPVIAVTGSVGKTSTKDIVCKALESKYKVLKTIGNFNNEIGMPLTILKLKNHNCMVLEMGMNHFHEISLLTKIAKPTIGIITNIGTAHIGNLGSRENILKAKLELLEGLSGPLIINNDNDLLHEFHDYENIIRVGINNQSDYTANNIKDDDFNTEFDINSEHFTIPIGGLAFVYNTLFAYAVAQVLKVENISKNLKDLSLTKSRLERIINKRGTIIIDDTYNASLDSMKNSLEILGKCQNKKIAYLGDMFELGEYEKEIHQEVGFLVKNNNVDVLITVGKLAKYIASGAIEKGFNKKNIYSFCNIEDSYKFLDEFLLKDDIILLKASHSMNFNKVVDYIKKI